MKICHAASAYEAALPRIRWMFDDFPNVIVSVSGGMDVRWLKQVMPPLHPTHRLRDDAGHATYYAFARG